MKKKELFIAPKVTRVINDNLMAAVCNEQFIYTSAGGATSDIDLNYTLHIDQ